MSNVLLRESRGRVLTLALNRPDSLNALNTELLEALRRAWVDFNRDRALWVAVLTGTGDRAFCVGADLKEIHVQGPRRKKRPGGIHRGMVVRKPVICAINGTAVGGGLELAMACDLRIAADHAKLGLTEVKRALIPAGGGTQRLPRLVPMGKAMEMLLTGETITAQEALALGLVNRVVPIAELPSAAAAMAEKLCENGPLAMQAIKRAVGEGLEKPLQEGMALESELIQLIRKTKDSREGIAAFVQKRKPDYRGE